MSTETLTHAWTVRHPFALAVATGIKPIENKKERPPMALLGKLIGIHAGLQWARKEDMPYWPTRLHPIPVPDDPRFTYGALIGVARLVGVVRRDRWGNFRRMRGAAFDGPLDQSIALRLEPWWRGPWGWLLEGAVLLPEPIPMRGQQGLWRLPDDDWNDNETMRVTSAQWALEQWRKAREGA